MRKGIQIVIIHKEMQLLENLYKHLILKMDLEYNIDQIQCTQEEVPVTGPC
jgi:hypothetical protein